MISPSDAPVFVGGRFDGFVFDCVNSDCAFPQYLDLPNGDRLHIYRLHRAAGRREYRHSGIVLMDGGAIR